MRDRVILLVEDNPDDQELTLRALRSNNFHNRVIVAADGADALDFLFAKGAHADRGAELMPQLVLLDLKLPKVDGLEVLERMRADPKTRCVPVVVLSSSNQERDITRSYERGANSFIRKPVDFVQFNDALRHLGYYWLNLNVTPETKGI